MKKNLTNRRVVNSIGIGILAMITSGTPVLAALNNAMNDSDVADPAAGAEVPAETEDAAATQNAEIINVLTETQDVIQNVQDELIQQGGDFGGGSEEPDDNSGDAVDPVTPPDEEDTEGGSDVDQQQPAETVEPSDGTQTEEPDNSQQPSEDPEAHPEETDTQTSPEDPEAETTTVTSTENPETTPEDTDPSEPGGESGSGTEEIEEADPTINDYLEESKDAIGKIKEDVIELDKKNTAAEKAVEEYNETVKNPNNFIDSVLGFISDASSAVTGAAASVNQNDAAAKEQAQIAVDAQAKVYGSSEEAAAAKEQAQEAATAADEAYKAAQAAVEEAENNKKIADDNLAFLKSQKDEAEAALEEANARVQDAQEMLRVILASYGIDEDAVNAGAFNPDQLAGDAKVAYDSAMSAVGKAKSDLEAAQKRYMEIAGQVEDAANKFRDADKDLGDSKDALASAITDVENKLENLDASKFDAVMEEYKEKSEAAENSYLTVEEARETLNAAQEAYEKAKEVKEKADAVLDKATNAADAAKCEEAEKIAEAAEAAKEAEEAIKENAAGVEEAINAANSAKQSAEDAIKKAERALECLRATKKTAEEADRELKEAEKELEDANFNYEEASSKLEEARKDFGEIQREAFEKQIEQVKGAQEKLQISSDDTSIRKLAGELIRFYYISQGETIEYDDIDTLQGDGPCLISVRISDEKYIKFTYLRDETDGLKIEHNGNICITEKQFNEKVEEYVAFESAEDALSDAESRLKEAEQAKDYADVVNAMVEVRDALLKVQENAGVLAGKEEKYQENADAIGKTLAELAGKLLNGGKEIEEATDTLSKVSDAQAKVEEAINALSELSAQTNVDQSAYDSLMAAYNSAVAEHADAVKALKESITGLDSAERQKNRAKAAADAEFYYNSVGNENPTTPTPPETTDPTTPTPPETTDPTTPTPPETTDPTTPTQPGTTDPTVPTQPVNPIQPVYGTLIDTITSPIISSQRVPAGTGYTYTVGGQRTYTVPEGEATGEETTEENLVNVEENAVPLAEVGENDKTNNTKNTKTTRAVSDEKVPLADIETENNKTSWWWILLIALLGATGTEMYIRHKEKTEQERKSKNGKQGYVKI